MRRPKTFNSFLFIFFSSFFFCIVFGFNTRSTAESMFESKKKALREGNELFLFNVFGVRADFFIAFFCRYYSKICVCVCVWLHFFSFIYMVVAVAIR